MVGWYCFDLELEFEQPESLGRLPNPGWVGLKGAAFSATPDDASTGANGVSEGRSESWELRTRGLSGCL